MSAVNLLDKTYPGLIKNIKHSVGKHELVEVTALASICHFEINSGQATGLLIIGF